jgi:hypothetical protein
MHTVQKINTNINMYEFCLNFIAGNFNFAHDERYLAQQVSSF